MIPVAPKMLCGASLFQIFAKGFDAVSLFQILPKGFSWDSFSQIKSSVELHYTNLSQRRVEHLFSISSQICTEKLHHSQRYFVSLHHPRLYFVWFYRPLVQLAVTGYSLRCTTGASEPPNPFCICSQWSVRPYIPFCYCPWSTQTYLFSEMHVFSKQHWNYNASMQACC